MIKEFKGKYRWLSNFAPCKVQLDGIEYPSTENAYQAAKTINMKERTKFETITAGQAKRAGKRITTREDWDEVKLRVMEDLNRQKYSKGLYKAKLLATGEVKIQEGNYWGDRFWGVCNGAGLNHLGKIIMKIRTELNQTKVG